MIGAIDIGGTKIAVGVVSEDGKLLASRVCPTAPESGWRSAVTRMAEMLTAAQAEAGGVAETIGIGCTGPIDPSIGFVVDAALLPGWKDAPIAPALASRFRVPVAMENDTDAAVLAEAAWGCGRGRGSVIYVTISTGIGAGIVHNGKLYRGSNGSHPELGHLALEMSSGPLCYCGLNGCWESLAAGPALEVWYAAQPEAVERLNAEEICRRARAGEPLAQRAIAREAYYIGLGLVNLVTAYCPDVIAMGGGVMRSSDLFLTKAREMILRYCTQVPAANTSLVETSREPNAALYGAACVALHRAGRLQLKPAGPVPHA